MNKKQIEYDKMANLIWDNHAERICANCMNLNLCTKRLNRGGCNIEYAISKTLMKAGIGDKKQAVKEFKNKFWDKICIELNELLGQNPSLRIEMKQYIEYILNELFTNLYGEKNG